MLNLFWPVNLSQFGAKQLGRGIFDARNLPRANQQKTGENGIKTVCFVWICAIFLK